MSRAAAQGVDVIRGQVTGPNNAPIENANVTATSVQGGVNRNARTDRSGRFTITFPGAEGDYFVQITALGFAPKRFEVKRTADQDILLADAKLSAMVMLDTMRATAERARVSRNDPTRGDIAGTEQAVSAAAVSAAQQGDLNAMAASIPGVTPVTGADGDPSGFSVLGLSADQNNTTLNGANFGSSNIPRDAQTTSSLNTSTYDVSRGGFSGANFNLNSGSGSNFIRRTLSLNLDSPKMQWTDATARALGQQYNNTSLGGAISGPIVMDKAYYSMSYQLGRRTNDLQTLYNTDASALQASGVAADSIVRLIQLAQNLSIPTSVSGGLPSDKLSDQGLVFGSLNYTPPNSSSGATYNTTFNGNWTKQTPVGQLTGEFPAHSGTRTNFGGGVQFGNTAYLKGIFLTETTLNHNASRNYGSPYALLPNGSVLINSTFADGTSGQRTIGFGGSSTLSTESTNFNIGFTNQLSWMSIDNKHRLKLATELRRDAYEQNQTTNSLGTFFFNSLADLQANRPAYYSRTLAPRIQNGSDIVGAISLGDSYRRSDDLQLQYGLRVDGNMFGNTPTLNPAVEAAFGVKNNSVPNRLYLSPRIGFSWTIGEAPQIAAFDGAVRGPRAVMRGGIGVFQNTPQATLTGNSIDNTGLSTGLQQLTCVGPAAPIPQWAQYASNPSSIPMQCADGTSGTVFASTAPNVTMFDKDYQERRSIRGNLSWSGPVLGNRFQTSVNATAGVNQHQSSFVDLNFAPTTRFSLADEGNRPIYVNPSSIVPTTGAIAVRDAKVNQAFNRVTQLRSDLESNSKQLQISVAPISFNSSLQWNLSYVLADNREQTRGFQSTVSDPTRIEWSRSQFDSRHQINLSLNYNAWDLIRINWFTRFASGSTFTPQLSADVNGDGYTNDRAFIFNPATASDPAVASGIQNLLNTGSAPAKECLRSQLGKLAERNSCQGPWTSTANLSFSFNPLKVKMPQRATLSFSVSNPLGAADLLLHGESKLHGWGQQQFSDQTLMYVKGFDPATNRYKYEVNPRFGSTNPTFQAFRTPVTLTMQIRVDVGPSRERQQLTQMLDLGRGREGQKMPEQFIKLRYGNGGVINPMAQILRQADTLGLTGPQADSMASINRAFTIRLDSIWTPLAKYLGNLPDHYDQGDAYDRYKAAREASVDLLIALSPRLNSILTDEQKRKLPALVASHLDVRYLQGIRSGTQGNTGGGPFMGGFLPGGGGPGAGGGGTMIIRGG